MSAPVSSWKASNSSSERRAILMLSSSANCARMPPAALLVEPEESVSRSTSTTSSTPRRRRWNAALAPSAPPPTTTASALGGTSTRGVSPNPCLTPSRCRTPLGTLRGVLRAFREWRIDRMTDRVARRPHGAKARATYGARDVHSFAWAPVLEALGLTSDDHLLDVGCGGGVFMRHAHEATGCRVTGVDH